MRISGFSRRNLELNVIRTPSDEAKREQLVEVIQSNPGSGIVYVANSHIADELRGYLFTKRIAAARYHEKMRSKDRQSIRDGFLQGRFRIVIATRQAGADLNKPDIRFVVHYQFTDCLETYVAEATQAGLDGKPAVATLFYRLEDKRAQSPFCTERYPSREESICVYDGLQALIGKTEKTAIPSALLFKECDLAEDRFRLVLAQLEAAAIIKRGRGVRLQRLFHSDEELDQGLHQYEERYQKQRDMLNAVMRYAQGSECRVEMLGEYFGGPISSHCGKCDNCRRYDGFGQKPAQQQAFALAS